MAHEAHLTGEDSQFVYLNRRSSKMSPNEVWIPLSMFIGLSVVLSLWGLSPELIENLVNPPVSPQRDLRRGVISVLAAVAIALFALFIGDEDAVGPLLGISMFPLSIGAGFLLMHRFGKSG
jgi:hypothetical protein